MTQTATRTNRATVIDTTEGLEQHQARARAEAQALVARLTPREVETLALIGSGYPQARAAAMLGCTRLVVAQYLWRAASKTGLRGRVALIRLALRAGIATVWDGPVHRSPAPAVPAGRPRTTTLAR